MFNPSPLCTSNKHADGAGFWYNQYLYHKIDVFEDCFKFPLNIACIKAILCNIAEKVLRGTPMVWLNIGDASLYFLNNIIIFTV